MHMDGVGRKTQLRLTLADDTQVDVTTRRSFLAGLVASTALAACPVAIEAAISAAPAVDWKVWYEQWMNDAMDVLVKCWEDQIIFGVSAHQYTDVYPYVVRIDPFTLEMPAVRGGLFND